MIIGGRCCASARGPRNSAGTEAAITAPACNTVRRLMSLASPVDRLAIPPSTKNFGTRALRFAEDCDRTLPPVKATALAPDDRQDCSPNYTEKSGNRTRRL